MSPKERSARGTGSRSSKSITTSKAKRSGSAKDATRSSKQIKKAVRRYKGLRPRDREEYLLGLMGPLLELFADVDDVFSEDDAMTPEKRQMGMGRLYRAWKHVRAEMDPLYDPEKDQRGGRSTKAEASLRLGDGTVLQPVRRRQTGTPQA